MYYFLSVYFVFVVSVVHTLPFMYIQYFLLSVVVVILYLINNLMYNTLQFIKIESINYYMEEILSIKFHF